MKKFLLSNLVSVVLFASNAHYSLHKIIPDSNTVLVNENYVDNLSKGWSLIGVEHTIADLSIFKNVDIAWIYDNNTKKWKVYSPMQDIQSRIDALPFNKITSIPAGSGIWVYRKIDLPKFTYLNYDVLEKNDNEMKVELKINIDLPKDKNLFYKETYFDNGKKINLNFLPTLDENYSTADINLSGGYHKITICEGVGFVNFSSSTVRYNVCKSVDINIDLPISEDKYTNKINLGFPSNALANDGKYLYVIDRNNYYLYKIDPKTGNKEKLFRVSSYPNSLDIYNGYFYVGQYGNNEIVKYDINGNKIASYNVDFPDGLTIMNGKIYSVQEDEDGNLLVLDANTLKKIGTFNTGIYDVCGLANDNKYLYVLAEDGDIYRIDPETKEKIKIFNNQRFLRDNNSDDGIEGITVYNGFIWISYIDDDSLYKIDIPLN